MKVASVRTFLPSVVFYAQWTLITANAALKAVRGRLTYDGLMRGSGCIVRALERAGVRFHVQGDAVLAKGEGPYVFVCNHMSAMETQVLPAIVGRTRPVTFVVKPSLMRYPIFKHVLGTFDPIVVTRTDPRADLRHVLTAGKQKLEAGVSVIIFPQARRSEDFDPEAFGSMGMRLAKAAKVPMVPIALATNAWGRGAWVEDMGPIDPSKPVRFAIGEPVDVGEDASASHRQVTAFIADHLASWSGSETA